MSWWLTTKDEDKHYSFMTKMFKYKCFEQREGVFKLGLNRTYQIECEIYDRKALYFVDGI